MPIYWQLLHPHFKLRVFWLKNYKHSFQSHLESQIINLRSLEIYEKSPFYRGFFVAKNRSFFNYFYLPKAGACSILASPRMEPKKEPPDSAFPEIIYVICRGIDSLPKFSSVSSGFPFAQITIISGGGFNGDKT